jgi:hypothetical protein
MCRKGSKKVYNVLLVFIYVYGNNVGQVAQSV